ncbi:hypothetical protein Tco_0598481 [Tanacetum coccineum]
MTQAEKMFVVKASTLKLGVTRTHNLYYTMKGGAQYVHGTSDDFKNHIRDVNAFIEESDAQILINKMESRKKFVPNFTFFWVKGYPADEALEDSISMGIPLPEGVGFTKETNRGLQYHSSASNIHTSNPFDALDDMESDEEVEVIFDETANLSDNNITRATYMALDASKT